MHSGKRYTFFQTVNWTRRSLLLFLVFDSVPILLYHFFQWEWLKIPWQPMSVIGIAVAFYLGFKNNSSYERVWEARKIWGGIVNTSRALTVNIRDFITNLFSDSPVDETALQNIHRQMVHRHVAWLHTLDYQMRQLQSWEHNNKHDRLFREAMGVGKTENWENKLQTMLNREDREYLNNKGNKASHILSLQSKQLKALRERGLIDDFRHMELSRLIEELYSLQGKSERIKKFPFPRQYAAANYFFVCIFIGLLPFTMLSIFADAGHPYFLWLAIPFSVLSSWVFWVMESIGEYSENPFEGLYNDVPITNIATGIEIDIRQMIGETELPKPTQPQGDMNILL